MTAKFDRPLFIENNELGPLRLEASFCVAKESICGPKRNHFFLNLF